MAAADVVLAPTSGAIYHTAALQTATAAGARFIALTGFVKDVLVRGGVFADFPSLAPRAIRLAELLTGAREARVVAPGSTDLTVRLDGRTAVPITGLVRAPGERSACPDVEAFIAPLETSAEGTVVVDASASIAGVLAEPLQLTIRAGRAVAIEGAAAEPIRAALAAAGTPDAFTLAELAFGLNPEGLIRGVIVEDEGVAGTGHVALGSNVSFGGRSVAPIHLDFVYRQPTLWLDGRLTIEDGVPLDPRLAGAT
jgi:leucyl aminopeptidase (aminopeptidase T)